VLFDNDLWIDIPLSDDARVPLRSPGASRPESEPVRLGYGPCAFPNCHGGGGFRPCAGFTGTAEDCLNCGHAYDYHA
jgi:uncharacterized protein (DUF983 family)